MKRHSTRGNLTDNDASREPWKASGRPKIECWEALPLTLEPAAPAPIIGATMSFPSIDWPSFLWGAAVAGVAAFGTSFLKKAGEAAFAHLQDKFSTTPSDHDKALFDEFQRDVAAEQVLRLFKVPDFDASFRRSDLRPLNTFVETWGSVEKEFMDSKLEAAKKKLFASAEKLATEISRLTVPVDDGSFSSVYSDAARRDHRGEGRPPEVIQDARTLNALAKPFAGEYEAFVRLCRERLKA